MTGLLLPEPSEATMARTGIDRAQAVPGMAHFAGTGPTGAICGQCTLFAPDDGRCSKFRELTGRRGAKVPSGSAACRYFTASASTKPVYDFGGAR